MSTKHTGEAFGLTPTQEQVPFEAEAFLDPQVVKRYKEDHGDIYATGVPSIDETFKLGNPEKTEVRNRRARKSEVIRGIDFVAEAVSGIEQSSSFYGHELPTSLEDRYDITGLRLLQEQVSRTRPKQLFIGTSLIGPITSMRIMHGLELDSHTNENVGHLSPDELAERNDNGHEVVVSKDLLDAQTDHLLSLLAVELPWIVLEDAKALMQFSGRARFKAVEDYSKLNLWRLSDGNIPNIMTAGKNLSGVFAKVALQTRNTTSKRITELMGERLAYTMKAVDTLITSIADTYDRYGYEQPQSLSAARGERPVNETTPPVVQQEAVEDAHEQASVSEAVVAEEVVAAHGVADAMRLMERYEMFERVIFPKSDDDTTTTEQLKDALDDLISSDPTLKEDTQANRDRRAILLPRLYDLIAIAEQFGGTIYRPKDGLFSGSHYYVTFFEYKGNRYAVAESPKSESATYVVAEQHAAGTCEEVLTSGNRTTSRELGAIQVKHSPSAPNGEMHVKKVIDKIHALDAKQP